MKIDLDIHIAVRRQSEAATALWIHFLLDTSKAVRAALATALHKVVRCLRTLYHRLRL